MTILFYSADPTDVALLDASPPPDISVRLWRPAIDGPPPYEPMGARNLCWWGVERLGLFDDHRFAEVSLWQCGKMLHRQVLTPRWFRFPFMAAGDLQIGDLWTHPEARGRGLARAAIGEARRLAGKAGRLWYVVDADNEPSVRLIETCGFRLVGMGRRTRPLGIALAGRFEMDCLPSPTRG